MEESIYLDRPDPIASMPSAKGMKAIGVVNTSDRLYDDFVPLIFLHAHLETSALTNERPEESDQFRFFVMLARLILRVLLA
jgi:hypothetical protein